jgi:hypothetical protein
VLQVICVLGSNVLLSVHAQTGTRQRNHHLRWVILTVPVPELLNGTWHQFGGSLRYSVIVDACSRALTSVYVMLTRYKSSTWLHQCWC